MPDVPRIVLDTNIFVAAGFDTGSDSARVLEAVRRGTLYLVWNAETQRETEYILCKIPPLSWSGVAGLFRAEHRFDGPTEPERFAFVPDPDDHKFAALAAAAGAPLLTLDDHLLGWRDQAGIPILTPGEFVQQLHAG